jgi:hypothetical protein
MRTVRRSETGALSSTSRVHGCNRACGSFTAACRSRKNPADVDKLLFRRLSPRVCEEARMNSPPATEAVPSL